MTLGEVDMIMPPPDLVLPPPSLKKMASLEINEISKKIKEQELGGQIRIIWTSDIGV